MSRRLTVGEVWAVRWKLRAGARHVEIAREFDLSVWTIARIDDDPRLNRDPVKEEDLPVDDGPADYEAKNLRRCEGCGAMVYLWPCVACQMSVTRRVSPAAEEVDGEASAECGARSAEWGEADLAPCGRRRRGKRGNVAFRAKMARREMRSAECGMGSGGGG